jgi:hypothetical protein
MPTLHRVRLIRWDGQRLRTDTHSSPQSSGMASLKDETAGDQNDHLKHKSASQSDGGKGNAAAEPKLPSHEVSTICIIVDRFLAFDHIPCRLQQSSKTMPQYSQDNYAKQNTGSERRYSTFAFTSRTFHTSASSLDSKHSADSYFKDVDTSVEDGTRMHKVCASRRLSRQHI